METSTNPPELLRLTSTPISPLEYFTDSSNTLNDKSDVVLVVENVKFYCHRLLLSLISPVFTRMFDGEFREHNDREIRLEGKTSESILELLKYIYPQFSGGVTNDNVESFLLLADEYMIEHLKKPCKDLLLDQLHLYKYVSLPTEYKLEKPSIKSKHFHASDSALNTSQTNEDDVFTSPHHGREHSTRRLASASRHPSGKPSSSYLKPTDKNGSGANSHPRYILALNHCQMPTFYDIQMKTLAFSNAEVELWFRRLRILYQIDKGRTYGEVVDAILSILQFVPTSILCPLARVTMETYAIDEMILNDIARARMLMLEGLTTDGDPYRSIRLSEQFQTMSAGALAMASEQNNSTKDPSKEGEQSSSSSNSLPTVVQSFGDGIAELGYDVHVLT